MRQNRKIALAFGLLALALASAYGAVAATGDKAAQSRDIGDWHLACGAPAANAGTAAPTKCTLVQNWSFEAGTGKDKRQVVGLAAIVHIEPGKDKPMTMVRLVTPIGSALMAGIVFKIDDGKETKVPYMVCQPGGCMTDLIFDKEMLDKFRGGKDMLVTYRGPDGADKAAKVSLKDTPKALAALEASSPKSPAK